MTSIEFNQKWNKYLESGYYGLAIDNELVIAYLDREFEQEVKTNPEFTYSQIKLKFGWAVVYAQTLKTAEWTSEINKMLGNY